MSILFLVENYWPSTSGVPVVVKYLAEGLTNRNYDVSVCTTLVKNSQKEEILNGVHIYRFDLRKTLLKRYVGEIDEYRSFVLSKNADVLIFECSECVTTDVLLDSLSDIKGKKIFHSHGFSGLTLKPFKWNVNLKYSIGNTYNWLRFKWYYNVTFKKAISKFDETLCLSNVDSSKKWLDQNARNVTVLQNAVDDMFLDPTKPIDIAPFVSLHKPYIVSVATYSKQKNQINILKEFCKVKSDCALIFVGPIETEYYLRLKHEVDNMRNKFGKLEVYLLLDIPRRYIPNIIGNAALYLVGSTFEEYSISLIEAMSKGVPFVSVNVGNARILPGGITIPNISKMHDAIDNVLSDKSLYDSLSEMGKNFVMKNCQRSYAVDCLEKIIVNLDRSVKS